MNIYLDYHATTPTDPQALQAMLPYFGESYGNPSSSIHQSGQSAEKAVAKARKQVAELLGAYIKEILFTAGATESNNLALLGLAKGNSSTRRRILTTPIEHKAILEPCKVLQKQGYELVFLPITSEGLVDIEEVKPLINEDTYIVSVQAASNEIGTIQPIAEIAQMAHDAGAFIHTDAAQAVGKIPVDVNEWDVDLLSISAHKLYGPKGVGALYMRGGPNALPVKPLMLGGGQENGIRPGTFNVPGIVGLGEACRLCQEFIPEEKKRITALRDQVENALLQAIPSMRRNGAVGQRLPNNSSLTFPGIESEALILGLPELALSTGSACTTGALEPSHVLIAIGLSREDAYQTLRIGLGRFTTQEEITTASELMIRAIRSFSD
jgi:cysteine desulfurase